MNTINNKHGPGLVTVLKIVGYRWEILWRKTLETLITEKFEIIVFAKQ